MVEDHPTSEDFERFLQHSPRPSHRERNAQIVRHLLHDCEICCQTLRELQTGSTFLERLLERPVPRTKGGDTVPSKSYNYEWAFARTERVVAASLVHGGPARGLLDPLTELSRLPEGEQIRRVSQGGRFSDPDFIETLLERSHAARYQSPRKMLFLSRLAQLAAEACTAETAGSPARLADLQAQAWGSYGNALRVCGNLPEAEEALVTASKRFKQGSKEPRIRALLLVLKSSLRVFQRRLKEAIQLAEEAERIFQELGETQVLASTMVQRAIPLLYSGETEHAASLLQQAISLLDPEDDPQLLLAAHHNLARCYIDLDRPDEALATFVEAKPLYQRVKDPLILLRATWQEGLLLCEIGHLRSAEAALLRARKGFIEQGLAYEAAVVGLDLADTYSKLGRTEDLRRILEEGMPIFRSLRVERETLASLLRLRQAAGLEGDPQS